MWGEDAWRAALAVARSLNENVSPGRIIGTSPVRTIKPGRDDHDKDRPGDRFNRQAEWEPILCPHGWRVVGRQEGRTLWVQPNKDRGVSATTGYCKSPSGSDLLYVFTSSAPCFEAGRAYDRFGAYAALYHHRDMHAAAVALAASGYGSDRPRVRFRIGKAVTA